MKGILFTELLFHKTVDGSKTMTRREGSLKAINDESDKWVYHGIMSSYEGGAKTTEHHAFANDDGVQLFFTKPRYKAGEVVYIKEPVADYRYEYFTGQTSETRTAPAYKYGCKEGHAVIYGLDGKPRIIPSEGLKFGNKLFMGANKARAYIRITDVRVERLYDISDSDCEREGVEYVEPIAGKIAYKNYMDNDTVFLESPQQSFFSLFRFANKIPKSTEIKNIWCFVYSYYLCDREGNKL